MTQDDSNHQPRKNPTLSEPIEVAKFWRNRKGEAVVVQLREYEGRPLIDCRVNFTNADGQLQPTKKGLSISVRYLPELVNAVTKALKIARERGVLPNDDGAER